MNHSPQEIKRYSHIFNNLLTEWQGSLYDCAVKAANNMSPPKKQLTNTELADEVEKELNK